MQANHDPGDFLFRIIVRWALLTYPSRENKNSADAIAMRSRHRESFAPGRGIGARTAGIISMLGFFTVAVFELLVEGVAFRAVRGALDYCQVMGTKCIGRQQMGNGQRVANME